MPKRKSLPKIAPVNVSVTNSTTVDMSAVSRSVDNLGGVFMEGISSLEQSLTESFRDGFSTLGDKLEHTLLDVNIGLYDKMDEQHAVLVAQQDLLQAQKDSQETRSDKLIELQQTDQELRSRQAVASEEAKMEQTQGGPFVEMNFLLKEIRDLIKQGGLGGKQQSKGSLLDNIPSIPPSAVSTAGNVAKTAGRAALGAAASPVGIAAGAAGVMGGASIYLMNKEVEAARAKGGDAAAEAKAAEHTKMILGAGTPDSAMAEAIQGANGEKTPEQIQAANEKRKKELKDAPWYTRMYGIGEESYRKENKLPPKEGTPTEGTTKPTAAATPAPTPAAPSKPPSLSLTPAPLPAAITGGAPATPPTAAAPAPAASTGTGLKPPSDTKATGLGLKPKVSISGDDDIKAMIKKHEGVRYQPYKDSLGLWTVGVGHLIGDGKSLPPEWNRTFSPAEVDTMFEEDYAHHKKAAQGIPGFGKLNEYGQGALTDLTFNMGPSWYKKWPNFTKQVESGDVAGAADNLESSKWYGQVGNRGPTIVSLMRAGGEGESTKAASETPTGQKDSGVTEGATKVASGGNLVSGSGAPVMSGSGQPVMAGGEQPTGNALSSTPPSSGSIFSRLSSALGFGPSVTAPDPTAAPGETGVGGEKPKLEENVKLKDSSVNLGGLDSNMKDRMAMMAAEFQQMTGKKLQINSGFRDPKEQAELYAKYGSPRAAPPGKSRHESGIAFDMNSGDAATAISLGLFDKYGFTRPVPGETWHIEPVETAKRGAMPDNPFSPGTAIAVAGKGGKPVVPASGESASLKEPAKAATAESAPPASATTLADASSTVGMTGGGQAAATPVATPSPVGGQAASPAPTSGGLPQVASASPPQTSSNVGALSERAAPQVAQAPIIINNNSSTNNNMGGGGGGKGGIPSPYGNRGSLSTATTFNVGSA